MALCLSMKVEASLGYVQLTGNFLEPETCVYHTVMEWSPAHKANVAHKLVASSPKDPKYVHGTKQSVYTRN